MHSRLCVIPDHLPRIGAEHRNYFLLLISCLALVPLLYGAFIVAIDPYYIFGSPSWRGFNAVRPFYEPHVVTAKPYQVSRIRPEAVSLGSSRVEVGIDPRHPGWASSRTFNFALPSSNSYAVMLAFLHAQHVGTPLKQAVVGLDFFAYNINFPLASDLSEQRFIHGITSGFQQLLSETHTQRKSREPAPATAGQAPGWDEALYLAVNPDVAAAIGRKEFKSGREHYELAGRAERRLGSAPPANWDEAGYLQVHPDVANAVAQRQFVSGYHHYLAAGRTEGRLGGFQPDNWNESAYLAANPGAGMQVALGRFGTGYLHYASIGKSRGLIGGLPPSTYMEKLRLRWPALDKAAFQLKEIFNLIFSTTSFYAAVQTVGMQSEPATFDDKGMRVWEAQEKVVREFGGSGTLLRTRLQNPPWRPMLIQPNYIYCFVNEATGATTFDPLRFMLRSAYAEGTDLRLYVTPLHASVRFLIKSLGLELRYQYWLKELVRINESEAARAGRKPVPLWDFSNANSITREPIPSFGDTTPMRWFWENSHYRRAAGDLILDRVLGYRDPARSVPDDFGVLLTAQTIDSHVARSSERLLAWADENAALTSQITAAVQKATPYNRQSDASCW